MQVSIPFTSVISTRWVLAPMVAVCCATAIAQSAMPTVTPSQAETNLAIARSASSDVLAHEPSGAVVRVADVLSELKRADPTARQTILSKPEMVQQIANNLLVRRMLAMEAERTGLKADPVLVATIAIAQDRVLSDAFLASMDAQNEPSGASLEAYARDVYKSNLTKFETPAQTRAHHILLPNKGAESLMQAKELLAQLRAGASFEDLAKAKSADQGSAVRGGDLGFFGAGKMVPSFEEALNKLSKPGDLSEPVESEFGYHIIRLDERRDKTVQPFAEVREKLLADARTAILSEFRVQKVKSLSAGFVFETKAFEALAKSVAQ